MEPPLPPLEDAYRSLMEDFAQLVGLRSRPGSLHHTGNFKFNGVALTIALDSREGQLVQVFIDFGACPTDKALPVYKRLLEVNLLLGAQGSPRLALDPVTDRVVFTYSSALHGLTAQALLAGIEQVAGQASEWRESFFIDETPPARAQGGMFGMRHALHV
ncbi:CesT family type III secretion system chaperone [Caenimonas koreensis]|uniref:CesT family type III secretion system chaperone n=1 Tax=Caenimonas koreensis TaxID=367474 RepID=UPI003783E821